MEESDLNENNNDDDDDDDDDDDGISTELKVTAETQWALEAAGLIPMLSAYNDNDDDDDR